MMNFVRKIWNKKLFSQKIMRRNFSTALESIESRWANMPTRPISLVVYTKFNEPKQFYFDAKISLAQFEECLISEEPEMAMGLRFYVSDGSAEYHIDNKKDLLFDLIINQQLTIKLNGVILSYYYDSCSNCVFGINHDYESKMRTLEVAEGSSFLLTTFMEQFNKKAHVMNENNG